MLWGAVGAVKVLWELCGCCKSPVGAVGAVWVLWGSVGAVRVLWELCGCCESPVGVMGTLWVLWASVGAAGAVGTLWVLSLSQQLPCRDGDQTLQSGLNPPLHPRDHHSQPRAGTGLTPTLWCSGSRGAEQPTLRHNLWGKDAVRQGHGETPQDPQIFPFTEPLGGSVAPQEKQGAALGQLLVTCGPGAPGGV